jgi:guanylate kinase
VVSDTTRKPRINNGVIEENGEVYWFKSEQQFLDGLKAGQYIESAIIHEQQVSGINISELLKASQQHKTAITDVEPQGVASIIKIKPNTKTIFVIPPTFKEWLVRIDNRGILSPSEKKRRLQSMIIEINQGLLVDYYHFVVNGELDQAVIEIKDYIEDNHFDPIQEQENRQKARELSESAKSYLLKS